MTAMKSGEDVLNNASQLVMSMGKQSWNEFLR